MSPRIEPVDLIDHLLTILPETSSIAALPGGLARLAEIASLGGGPARLVYAEIEDCGALVASHLERADTPPSWTHHPPPPEQTWRGDGDDPASDGSGILHVASAADPFERAAWTDAIEYEGDFLILRGPVPVLVRGVGASLWRRCVAPATRADLVAATIADLGDHPRAANLVDEALTGLVEAGLLRPCAEPGYPSAPSARNTDP